MTSYFLEAIGAIGVVFCGRSVIALAPRGSTGSVLCKINRIWPREASPLTS